MAEYMAARRARRRRELIELLGGVCSHPGCETTEDLQFDHVEPGSRTFLLSGKGLDRSWSAILIEVAKCQLLCWPHHWAKTVANGETRTVEHGGGVSGKKNCKCVPCKARKSEYYKAYGHPNRVRQSDTRDKLYDGPGRYGTVEHGGGVTGKNSCSCDLCKAKKAEYARNRRSRMVKLGITDDR